MKHYATDFTEGSETLNGSVLEVQALDYEAEVWFLTSNNDNQLPLFPFKFSNSYLFLFWYVLDYFILVKECYSWLSPITESYTTDLRNTNRSVQKRFFEELNILFLKIVVIQ